MLGLLALAVTTAAGAPTAFAAQPPVGLGTATSYAVLGATTVTNTGPSVIAGDIGLSPGTAVTGFPPGVQASGTKQVTTAAAAQAQNDLTTAYNDAAGRIPATAVTSDLGGQTLGAGVYRASSVMSLTGTLTLRGGPSDVFVFQAGSALLTASNATVALIGGASACNVFWQVGSSTTLGTNTTFVGTVMSLTSATLKTGATVQGRVMARNGAVTLDTNTIRVPSCGTSATGVPTPTTQPTVSTSPTATPSAAPSSTPTSTPSGLPAEVPTSTPPGTPTGQGTGPGAGTGPSSATGPGAGTGPGTSAGSGTGTNTVIPTGHPETGEGGAAPLSSRLPFIGGIVALLGALVAARRAVRRP